MVISTRLHVKEQMLSSNNFWKKTWASKYVMPALAGPTSWIWEASTAPGERKQMGEWEQAVR